MFPEGPGVFFRGAKSEEGQERRVGPPLLCQSALSRYGAVTVARQ